MTATPEFPPLVEAYLADLDRALAGTDPRERAETVAAVREHAVESLARHGRDDEAARRVIGELGPVEHIAAEVTPAPAAAAVPVGKAEPTDIVLAALAVLLWPLAPVFLVWAIVRLRAGVGSRALQWVTIVLSAVTVVVGLVLVAAHVLSVAAQAGPV